MTPGRRLYVLLLVAACSGAAHDAVAQAQEPARDPQDAARFKTEIMVTPERGDTPRALIPSATVVLDAPALAAMPAVHPSEFISFLTGFSVARGQFSESRPVITARGFFGGGEAEYVVLLVDGVPVADVESGLIDWSLVPASSVRRIEVSRGPGASLYGDSAVGGVIQILTDRSSRREQLTVTGGSFNSFTADGSFGRRAQAVGLDVSGAARSTDGAFEHARGRDLVGVGRLDGSLHRWSWRGNVSAGHRTREDPGALRLDVLRVDATSSDPVYRLDALSRDAVSGGVLLQNRAASWQPQAHVYFSRRDEDAIRTVPLVPGLADTRARALTTRSLGGNIGAQREVAAPIKALLRFGADLSRDGLDTSYRSVAKDGGLGALDSQASGHRVRAGLFSAAMWDPATRIRVSAAIRWDGVDDRGFGVDSRSPQAHAWSPRVGAVVHLTDAGSVTAFGQVSKAFKMPTLDQLFDPRPYPDFAGGTFTISNRHLVPQRATNIEAGVTASIGALRVNGVAYRMAIENEIDFDVRTFSYGNIGRSQHLGAEIEADARWTRRVRTSVSYTLSRAVDAASRRQLKNVPRHLFAAGAQIDLPWDLGAYARLRHADGAFFDDSNAYRIGDASILDIRLRRPFGPHAMFADGLNLAGIRYEQYGYTLADGDRRQVPYAYPGPRRSVRAGVTLAFK